MNRDLDLMKFCHWMLTMSEIEAAIISRQCLPFKDDKEKVAAFTVMFYRDKR